MTSRRLCPRAILSGMGACGLIALIAGAGTPAIADPEASSPGVAITGERAPDGERCIVCGRPLGEEDAVYQIRGRWVPLHAQECEAVFREDPDAAFASLRPRGALFQEEFAGTEPLRWGWFLFGLYALLGLLSAALCGHMAYPRGLPPAKWFFLGLVLNLFAVAALLWVAKPVQEVPARLGRLAGTAAPAPCPACGEPNHPAARRCTGCGAALSPASASEAVNVLGGDRGMASG